MDIKKKKKQPELPMGGLHPLEDAAAGIDNFNASFGDGEAACDGGCDAGCGSLGEAIRMSRTLKEGYALPSDAEELVSYLIDICGDYGFEPDYKNLSQPIGYTMLGNLHFQIIGTDEITQHRDIESLKNADSSVVREFLITGFENLGDALEEYCEGTLGTRCTYNAGVDQDGWITCGFDVYDLDEIFPEEEF